MYVLAERSTRKSRSFSGSPIASATNGFHVSGTRDAQRDEVVRAEHVDGAAPELRVAAGEHQRHVAAVRAADHAGALDVDAVVFRQNLLHREHVVEPVLAAPVAVDALRVVERRSPSSRGRSGRTRRSPQREDLDQRHREPREVGALLALRAAVDVVDERPRSLVAERVGGEVEACRDAQSVVRVEGRILAGGEQLRREPERAFARALLRRRVLVEHVELGRHRRGAERAPRSGRSRGRSGAHGERRPRARPRPTSTRSSVRRRARLRRTGRRRPRSSRRCCRSPRSGRRRGAAGARARPRRCGRARRRRPARPRSDRRARDSRPRPSS